MKSSRVLCCFALLSPLLAGAQEIQSICNAIKGVYNCKAIVTLPTGAKAKQCRNKFIETDSCKTRLTYRYPCPTLRRPGRSCPGWTCVPGTRESWINIPCGIEITTKNVNLCATVRDSLGGVGEEFIAKTTAMCSCIPKALNYVSQGLLGQVAKNVDVSASTVSLLSEYMELQQCFVNNAFTIQDNKAELLRTGSLAPSTGWTVIQAAEITLATYATFASTLAPCFVGACEPDLIRGFFTDYVQDSQKLMTDQITAILTPWTALFEDIKKQIQSFGDAFDQLERETTEIQSAMETVRGELCKDVRACASDTMTRFYNKVSASISFEREFAKSLGAVGSIVETVTKMIDLVQDGLAAIEAIPDAQSIIELITSGQLKKVADMARVLQIAQTLPRLVEDVTTSLPSVTEFITSLELQANELRQNFTEILAEEWLADEELAADGAANARAGVERIQALFGGPIFATLQGLTQNIDGATRALTELPFLGGSFAMDVGVASYRRWSDVSLDLPCTRQRRKRFTVTGGFTGDFDYPEFYMCPYKKTIPWPNHHIPYIKFRFARPAVSQVVMAVAPSLAATVAADEASTVAALTGPDNNPAPTAMALNVAEVTMLDNGTFAGQFEEEVQAEDIELEVDDIAQEDEGAVAQPAKA